MAAGQSGGEELHGSIKEIECLSRGELESPQLQALSPNGDLPLKNQFFVARYNYFIMISETDAHGKDHSSVVHDLETFSNDGAVVC